MSEMTTGWAPLLSTLTVTVGRECQTICPKSCSFWTNCSWPLAEDIDAVSKATRIRIRKKKGFHEQPTDFLQKYHFFVEFIYTTLPNCHFLITFVSSPLILLFMKFISWNVNGLRACEGKGFSDIFHRMDADFFCLQETKMQAGQLDLTYEGYQSYWNYAEKKGYSGTAIFTRHTPVSVKLGIGVDEHDHEGRTITLEYEDFFLITAYVPNSQDELRRLDYRMRWEDDFRQYVLQLDAVKPVIICGDMNVAHQEIDLKNPKTNRRNAGFTDEERDKMTLLLESGFTDTFRYFYPDLKEAYSWWSYRFRAREKNTGWRIDYFLVSNRLQEHLQSAAIHSDILGSDHCPVEVVIEGIH